jgi:hypothetical protein
MRGGWQWWMGTIVLFTSVAATAAPMVIDFETLADGASVTTQFSVADGVTFTNATAITARLSLNEFEFPPVSGTKVVFDTGGPIEITFADLMARVAGYFTYLMPLEFAAYNDNGARLDFAGSHYSSNLGVIPDDPSSGGAPGSSPNEFLQLTSVAGIRRVVIAGNSDGGSFTLDDLTFERTAPVNGVPEPGTLLLLAAGLVGLARRRGAPGG